MAITRQQIELEGCSSPVSVWVFDIFGDFYITTGCFDMFWQVCQNIWWRQHPVGIQQSSRFLI